MSLNKWLSIYIDKPYSRLYNQIIIWFQLKFNLTLTNYYNCYSEPLVEIIIIITLMLYNYNWT